MEIEFKELGEISKAVNYGFTASAVHEEIGPKFLRITDIQNEFIDWKTVPFCNITPNAHQKNKLEIGDIVIARTGNSTGSNAIIRKGFDAVFASYLIRFRINELMANPFYVGYVLKSKLYKDFVSAIKGGSAQPGANAKQFSSFRVPLLPINQQRKIASILSSLDDKIELNLEMNKTLEEMAMAIYKEWFVDFGPFKDGEFVDTELGRIPKGWEVIRLGDAVETLGGGTPKTSVKEYWENGTINWYSPTDLTKSKSLFSIGSEKKISNSGLSKSSAKLFPPYSLLMTSRATIGEITINRCEASTNQGFITMIPNNIVAIFQLVGWVKQNMRRIKSIADGSTFPEISKGVLRDFKILICPNPNKFLKVNSTIYNMIESNIVENNVLIETRDYLLPKLISGEIRVKEAEDLVKNPI